MAYFNKIFVIVFLYAILPNITLAEDWRLYDIGKSGDEGYFDKDSIKRTPPKVQVWINVFPKEKSGAPNIDHIKALVEFNCREETFHSLDYVAYNKDGNPIEHGSVTTWSPIIPGTMHKKLNDTLCNASPKRSYIIYLGDEIKKVIPECWRIQNKSGMIGLIKFSQTKYKELAKKLTMKNIEKCVAVDMYSNMLDSQFARSMGHPPNSVTIEYFSTDNFQRRIAPYLIRAGIALNEANDFLTLWEAAVDKELGKILGKEISK
jgi:hypothetical protein